MKDNFHPVIEGQVYRSAQMSPATFKKKVAEYGIKTVVNLQRPKRNDGAWIMERATAALMGAEHHDIDMDLTFSPRIDQVRQLRDLLVNAPKPILVHCRAGADRTGLAAVMVKLLDGHSSLQEAREQIGLKYHVLRDNSIGIPFFDAYVQWLTSQELPHNTANFNHWLDEKFVDQSGNIHFLVDAIHGQLWERPWGLIDQGHEFKIRRSSTDVLKLSGWAFDTRHSALLESVQVFLGGIELKDVRYGTEQPWLLQDFPNPVYLYSGWRVSQPLSQFQDSCHELTLQFNRLDGSSWTSPPAARICIE